MKTLQIAGDHGYGGGGYLLIRWCRHLVDRGWQVDVLTSHSDSATAFRRAGARLIDSIPIARRPSVMDTVRATAALARLIRRERYDVVHTYNVAPSVIGRLAARLAGCGAIVHHQAGWASHAAPDPLRRRMYRVVKYLASAAGHVSVCVGNGVARDAGAERLAPARTLRVIRNGIELNPYGATPERREELRRKLGVGPDTRIVGTVGRLARDKDIETLLRGFDALPHSTMTDTVLLLAGEGEDGARLRMLAASLATAARIVFMGFRQDIPETLGGLDVFVTTTRREGLSIAILEAMATSLPVVATGITANLELVEHEKTGLLVPVGGTAEVSRAMQRLLDDKSLRQALGQSARSRVESEFRLDRMLAETYDLYEELTTGKP